MRLSFSTNAFKKYDLNEAIDYISKAGYDGVELLCDIPHLYPPNFSDKEYERLIKTVSERNLTICNLNAFTFFAKGDTYNPSWIDPNPDIRRLRVQHTLSSIDCAKRLGVPNISTEPGGGADWKTNIGVDGNLSLFEDGIAEVLDHARRQGVMLLIEPEPDLLIENSCQALDFLKRFDSPWLGINFDIGHFHCVGENPKDALERLYPYVKHVHLEDISYNIHKHLAPGDGDIDFSPVLGYLYDNGYAGYITVELYPYQDNPFEVAKKSYDYLNRFECFRK